MWTIFKALIESGTISPLSCFGSLAEQHVGLQLPNQESSPHPLRWRVKSHLPDYQESPQPPPFIGKKHAQDSLLGMWTALESVALSQLIRKPCPSSWWQGWDFKVSFHLLRKATSQTWATSWRVENGWSRSPGAGSTGCSTLAAPPPPTWTSPTTLSCSACPSTSSSTSSSPACSSPS